MKKISKLEETFALHCNASNISVVREHRFHPSRRWKFDFAIPERMIAIECEGAVWSNGRHTRGSGFIADCEKYNEAARLGWFVFRFASQQIMNGEAIKFILSVIGEKNERKI